MATIRAEGLTRRYGRSLALSRVSIEPPPLVTVLLGRNGAGKSTLLRLLMGVETPDNGRVTRDGLSITDPGCRREHLRRSGWLPQTFGYPPGMRVGDFVRYAAWLKEVPRRSREHMVNSALDVVALQDRRYQRLGQLSGGMLRRVGIAQAVVHGPDFVVLDEPTAGLDPEQRESFHQTVRDLATQSRVLVSTHLLEDVVGIAQHSVVLDHGEVRFDGPAISLIAMGAGADSLTAIRTAFIELLDLESRTDP